MRNGGARLSATHRRRDGAAIWRGAGPVGRKRRLRGGDLEHFALILGQSELGGRAGPGLRRYAGGAVQPL